MTDQDADKLAQRALDEIEGVDVIGLGTGQAATAFVRALGGRVPAGLSVKGVPTSEATARLARGLGIPLVSLEHVPAIDVTLDGADEVDRGLNLIKGYGGALVREKVVAAASRRLVILVGAEKLVPTLGHHGRLPVEVVPFAAPFCQRRLADMGLRPTVRTERGQAIVSDNGNLILDCGVTAIADPAALEAAVRGIPGVIGTGLFVGMADRVLVWDGTVKVMDRRRPR